MRFEKINTIITKQIKPATKDVVLTHAIEQDRDEDITSFKWGEED